jgi:phage terminase small subunit
MLPNDEDEEVLDDASSAPSAAEKLTPKQKAFCEYWVVHHNGQRAAIAAGYAAHSARTTAAILLTQANVMAYVQELQARQAKRLIVDENFIVQGLVKNYLRAMQSEEITDKDGNAHGVYKYDGATANRALELLGKMRGLFTDKVEHSGTAGGLVIRVEYPDGGPDDNTMPDDADVAAPV